MDVDAIEPGVDFVKALDEQVAGCIAFIAVIGPRWLTARGNDGNPKLDNPTDYVRLEIESALKRDIRVIPVLVDGALMPTPSDLPSSLQALARRGQWKSPFTGLLPTASTSPEASSAALGLRNLLQRSVSLDRFRKRKAVLGLRLCTIKLAQRRVGPTSCFLSKGGSLEYRS